MNAAAQPEVREALVVRRLSKGTLSRKKDLFVVIASTTAVASNSVLSAFSAPISLEEAVKPLLFARPATTGFPADIACQPTASSSNAA